MKFKKLMAEVIAAALTLTASVSPVMSVYAADENKPLEIEEGLSLGFKKVDEDSDGADDYAELVMCTISKKGEYYLDIPSAYENLPVKSISNIAVSGDTNCIKSVNIPASVTMICEHPFPLFHTLEKITVSPDNKNFCSEDGILFNKDMTELIRCPENNPVTTYTIPDTVVDIHKYAFDSCQSLKSVTFTDNVKTAGWIAFGDCENLTDVTFGNGMDTLEWWIFSHCTNLGKIKIPACITQIGLGAFDYCPNIIVEVDENNPNFISENGNLLEKNPMTGEFDTLRRYSFVKNGSSYVVPDGIKTVTGFSGCTEFTSITLPEGVQDIGMAAFSGCINLENVKLPESLQGISDEAFDYCDKITEITLPENVSYFRGISHCKNLKSVTILNPECYIYEYGATISNGSDYSSGKNGYYYDGIIYGYDNSTAQAYAEKYGYKFESLGTYVKKWKVADLVELQSMYYAPPFLVDLSKYDMNKDGNVNVWDVILLKRKILEQSTEL